MAVRKTCYPGGDKSHVVRSDKCPPPAKPAHNPEPTTPRGKRRKERNNG
jgi:hypothetical protein